MLVKLESHDSLKMNSTEIWSRSCNETVSIQNHDLAIHTETFLKKILFVSPWNKVPATNQEME